MKVLKDLQQNETLLRRGYILLDFLSGQETETLAKAFYDHHPVEPSGLYASAHHQDFDFRLKMSRTIKQMLEPIFTTFSEAYRLLGSSYLAKSPKGNGVLSPHQDWNIVDEQEYSSYNLWIPLVDVNKKNGTIEIIEGSHLWHTTFRGPNIPSAYAKVEKKLFPKFFPVEISAGTALLYDHRLIHYSDNNRSVSNRLVTVSGVAPKQADTYYYFGNAPFVEQYYLEEDFYLRNNIFEGNKVLKLKEKFKYTFPQFMDLP